MPEVLTPEDRTAQDTTTREGIMTDDRDPQPKPEGGPDDGWTDESDLIFNIGSTPEAEPVPLWRRTTIPIAAAILLAGVAVAATIFLRQHPGTQARLSPTGPSNSSAPTETPQSAGSSSSTTPATPTSSASSGAALSPPTAPTSPTNTSTAAIPPTGTQTVGDNPGPTPTGPGHTTIRQSPGPGTSSPSNGGGRQSGNSTSSAPAPPTTSAPPPSSPSPTAHPEEAYNKQGVPTFADHHNASGPGSLIPFQDIVVVTCKVYDPSIPSVSPAGYWYEIADRPWNDKYFAAANTFLNGDPPAGPYTRNVDPAVPDC